MSAFKIAGLIFLGLAVFTAIKAGVTGKYVLFTVMTADVITGAILLALSFNQRSK